MPQRCWSYRYSSCEMMYVEILDGIVVLRLDHQHPDSPNVDKYSFADVLAGKLDAELRNQFGPAVPDEIKAAVRDVMTQPKLSPEEAKALDRIRRRQEGTPTKPKAGS